MVTANAKKSLTMFEMKNKKQENLQSFLDDTLTRTRYRKLESLLSEGAPYKFTRLMNGTDNWEPKHLRTLIGFLLEHYAINYDVLEPIPFARRYGLKIGKIGIDDAAELQEWYETVWAVIEQERRQQIDSALNG